MTKTIEDVLVSMETADDLQKRLLSAASQELKALSERASVAAQYCQESKGLIDQLRELEICREALEDYKIQVLDHHDSVSMSTSGDGSGSDSSVNQIVDDGNLDSQLTLQIRRAREDVERIRASIDNVKIQLDDAHTNCNSSNVLFNNLYLQTQDAHDRVREEKKCIHGTETVEVYSLYQLEALSVLHGEGLWHGEVVASDFLSPAFKKDVMEVARDLKVARRR